MYLNRFCLYFIVYLLFFFCFFRISTTLIDLSKIKFKFNIRASFTCLHCDSWYGNLNADNPK